MLDDFQKNSVSFNSQCGMIFFLNKRLQGISVLHVKDHKTGYLLGLEPFSGMGAKRLQLLKQSWADTFRWQILPELPVDLLVEHYSLDQGRPTKELYAMMGLMVLQQMHDMTDDQAVDQFSFNLQWRYALNISETDDAHAYLCTRTLWEMRSLMSKHGLEQDLFEKVTGKLAELYDVDPSLQRLDSTHLCSNMRSLGRVSILVTTIKRFMTNLKRQHREAFNGIDGELIERYFTKRGDAAFAATAPKEAKRKLLDVVQDLWTLINFFHDNSEVSAMSTYKQLVRVFNEQCVETENIDGKPIETNNTEDENESDTSEGEAPSGGAAEGILPVMAKPAKEVSSDSLQNPSDPDATYDGHKGQGFQVQIMETCTESAEEEGLSLITHVAVEAAHIHDGTAVMPAIEHGKQNGLVPGRLLADTAYGSDENVLQAAEQGVELIAPAFGDKNPESIQLDQFVQGDDGQIIECPNKCTPEQNKCGKNSNLVAQFSIEDCSHCPMLEQCPVKAGKKFFYLRYTKKKLRLAARRAHEKSEEFRKIYAMRAGIEAGNSEAKQTTGLGKLRIRGMIAVRFAVTLKLLGVNIRRATAFKLRKNDPKSPNSKDCYSIFSILCDFITHIDHKIRKGMSYFIVKVKISNFFTQNESALNC